MKRSDFIQGVTAVLGLAILPKSVTIKQFQRIYILQSFIRGFRFYEGINLLHQMREGDLLELVREPQNEYDKCAIALHFDKKKIGYLPREDNELLSKLMDADVVPLQAEITHLNATAETWENVHVAVYVLKELYGPLPDSANYLTVLKTPKYHSLKINNDKVVTIYNNDPEFDSLMDADEFYAEMVANSRDDSIYDILHADFGSAQNLEQALTEGRMIVNRRRLPQDLNTDKLVQTIDDNILMLDAFFGEQGFVVANTDQIAKLSGRIEKVVTLADKFGRRFYEIRFC
ncbi:MAG: HIRAN domain-containing protein [Bacteroidetes bacterium]|nr:HIRAN domain-containing protein [Bacteroidota bacterium]